MNLLRLDQAGIGPGDAVFRQSAAHGVLAFVALVAAAVIAAVAALAGFIPWPIAGVAMAVLSCFALVAGIGAWRSSRPGSWLLCTDGRRVLINLRSYMNAAFDEAEPCVVELSASDIVGFRAVTENTTGYDAANDANHDTGVFLEVALASHAHVETVAARLEMERTLRNRGSAWRHYPVTVRDFTLRLEWRGRHGRIEPGIETAMRHLASVAAALPPASETIDFGTPAQPPQNDDTDRAVRALAHQGRIVEATVLAARSLNLSTSEARQYVEQRR